MAERCYNCHDRASKGSVGMVRWCYECAADILSQPKKLVRSQAIRFELTRGRKRTVIGEAVWIPDFIVARYKAKS